MTAPTSTRVLVWMCVLIAVNQLGFGSVVPVLALYARSFGVAQSAIGLAIAVYGLARFLVSMPVGRLTDAVGRRTALALGGLVTACGNLLCAVGYSHDVASEIVKDMQIRSVIDRVPMDHPDSGDALWNAHGGPPFG